MKTKLIVDIHAYNVDNDTLLKVIAWHNEGKKNIPLDYFKSYVNTNNGKYEAESLQMEAKEMEPDSLTIFIGGKHTLTITERLIIGDVFAPDEKTNAGL